MRMNDVCLICNQKHSASLKKIKLQNMLVFLRSAGVKPKDGVYSYNWNLSQRCKYGMPCQQLKMEEQNCLAITREINSYLEAVSKSGNQPLFRHTLSYLQGEFPAIYNKVYHDFLKNKETE